MVQKLIRCTCCNEVIPSYEDFGDFGGESILPGVEWASDDLDEQKAFARRHAGHPTEELRVDPDTVVSDKPAMDPVRTSFVEATNGIDTFVIKRVRQSLDRPVSYELLPGRHKAFDAFLEAKHPALGKKVPVMIPLYGCPVAAGTTVISPPPPVGHVWVSPR